MEILFEKGIPGFENYRYFNVNIVEGNKKIYNIKRRFKHRVYFYISV